MMSSKLFRKANKKRKKAMKAMLQRTRAEAVESFKKSKAARLWVKQQANVLFNDWKQQQQRNLVVVRAKKAMLEYVKRGGWKSRILWKSSSPRLLSSGGRTKAPFDTPRVHHHGRLRWQGPRQRLPLEMPMQAASQNQSQSLALCP